MEYLCPGQWLSGIDESLMKNHEREMYVLMDENGQLISVDQSSGGYLYVNQTDLSGVKLWSRAEEAANYNRIMGDKYTLHLISFSLREVRKY